MKTSVLIIGGLLLAASAQSAAAAVPTLNMICGTEIEVHADEGGPVYIGGEEAKLNVVNENYAEASLNGTTVSIAINTDGSPNVSYTASGGVNGICNPADGETVRGGIPFFNAECPTDLSVHADQGGPVYINGKEAEVTISSPEYFEAALDGAVISVSTNPDQTLIVSYTATGGANGICRLEEAQ